MRWISTKERLPNKGGDYLCNCMDNYDGSEDMKVCPFRPDEIGGGEFVTESFYIVTHWSPLPPPPEPEQKAHY